MEEPKARESITLYDFVTRFHIRRASLASLGQFRESRHDVATAAGAVLTGGHDADEQRH